ncbi:MAG: hypothetical protein CSA55_04440 [Ilumatobacter coccineus]|uniref:Lipoprotein n=1 Tax=Ilumatobacter coccineus TaxID=467094 RepID=A0A2G6K8F5_9ACTN|nr:MAG: hypothetical protein CSA55_04440 [Ilumatobacter coccineus]
MKKRLVALSAAALFALSACGGGGASGDQGKVADKLIESAAEEGFKLDESCVNDVASKLSDEDAAKILEADDIEAAELSAEAEKLSLELVTCADVDALVDQMVAELGPDAADMIDTDCLKKAFKELDTSSGDPQAAMANAAMQCVSLGG